MNFNLDKDLIVFDIESTGADAVKDRIMQIALIKYPKDGGDPIEKNILMNPQYPIKPDAIAVHGITVDMVRNKPTFKEFAVEIFDFIGDADLGGYNLKRFDIPMLAEEFSRVGLVFEMKNRRIIDAMQVFYKMEPRTLKAALKFYCDKELIDAHDAMADTKATADVIWGQIQKYENRDYEDNDGNIIEKPVRNDMGAIDEFINDKTVVDYMGRFKRNKEGNIIFNFGNNRGEEAHKHPHTLRWMIGKDFPIQVKNIAKAILDGTMK